MFLCLSDIICVKDRQTSLALTHSISLRPHLLQLQRDVTPLTTAISPRDIQFIKCNGNVPKIRKDNMCTYQQEYLSQIVVLGKWIALYLIVGWSGDNYMQYSITCVYAYIAHITCKSRFRASLYAKAYTKQNGDNNDDAARQNKIVYISH